MCETRFQHGFRRMETKHQVQRTKHNIHDSGTRIVQEEFFVLHVAEFVRIQLVRV